MMRPTLAIFAAAAAISLTASPASADWLTGGGPRFDNGRWCANMSIGFDSVQKDCTLNSFEQCRQMVVAGNRGFCTQNPAYRPYDGPPRRYKRRPRR